jgi:hypothetical protein
MTLTPQPLYREFSSVLQAIQNCRNTGNNSWLEKHEDTLHKLVQFLPHGSGIDSGPDFNWDKSNPENPEKLVFDFSFHHMNDSGMYDGWTDHTLIVKPSLLFGIDLRITGRDRNQIKEYLYETFQHTLESLVWQTPDCSWHSEIYGETPPTTENLKNYTEEELAGYRRSK